MKRWLKNWFKWIIAGLVLIGLGLGVMNALSKRKAQQAAVTAAAEANAKAQAVVELMPADTVKAQISDIEQGVPISGTLKAVNSAVIKARVAGELQGLTVREGDTVKAGQVIARVDATEYAARLQQAQDQADAAKTQIVIAQRQFDNNKALVDQGFISKTALDTSLATLNSAQALHRSALANMDVTKKAVQDTVLRSPLAGVVSQRLVQNGERVSIDTRVIEVVDLSRMEMEASMSLADVRQVQLGQQADLMFEGNSARYNSQVVRINPTAQAGSRSVSVYLSVATNPLWMRPGLFVQGLLNTGKVTGLVVPSNAVRTDKPTQYVQVIEDNKVRHQTVALGKTGQIIVNTRAIAVTEILPGTLKENAILISGTVGTLREGTTVKFSVTPASTSK